MRPGLALTAVAAVAWAGADSRPVLVAFGDSITEGYGVSRGETYPDHLQKALDARRIGWRVVNAGVSADTTNNALDRLPSVIALQPRLVLLELGGNDGLRGLPVETTRANLGEIIARLQKAGARVLLIGMTLPANYGGAYIARFEAAYSALARQHAVTMISVKGARVLDGPGLMQRDGIHPTGEGYRKFAAYLLPFVEGEIRRTGK